MKTLNADSLVEFARTLEGRNDLVTSKRRRPFTVSVSEETIYFKPKSKKSSKPMPISLPAIQRFCLEFEKTRSLHPKDYTQKCGVSSYLVTLIGLLMRDELPSGELSMSKKQRPKVSNEKKNLNRLAGEFLVASRLTQRGYMITLQWGNTISYDILVFDKRGNVAFLEVKASASHSRRWVMQKKYANPEGDSIPLERRYVCCVDLAVSVGEPRVYVFPASVVAAGLHYYFNDVFPNSDSYHLSLDFKPQRQTKIPGVETVGERIQAESYLEKFAAIGVEPILG